MNGKKKRGRPHVYKPKTNVVPIRITDEELAQLAYICEKEDISKSDVFREGLRMMYNLTVYRD